MPSTRIAELEHDLARRREAGLWRKRREVQGPQRPRLVVDGRELLAFASNDYLGLASDPALAAAAIEGAKAFGVGAGASHLVCGHQAPHEVAEVRLAAHVAPCPDAKALLCTSGYLANLAILTALAGRGDAIFADRLNHACLNEGARLSRAALVRYRHGDVGMLRQALEATPARRRIIASDAVFSMDGDEAPLAALLELARTFDAWLVIDDAHGFGVLGAGRGSLADAGVEDERIVYMGTLGKAAGVAGAFVAAHPSVVETIVQSAPSYVFTTAMPALLACAIGTALDCIIAGEERRRHLFTLVQRFRDSAADLRWQLMPSRTPIQPLLVGDNEAAVALSEALSRRGIFVPAIRPPTVPAGSARLRITLSSAHTAQDVDDLVAALRDIARDG